MLEGRGFAFVDPHGDTAEKLLAMVPKERTEDVIYFSPADMDYPLGLNMFVQPDISHITLLAGDVIILCSDGLWAYVEDDEFAALATRTPGADELSQKLVDLALARHTDDNASVAVARIEQVGTPAAADLKPRSAWGRVAAALQSLF